MKCIKKKTKAPEEGQSSWGSGGCASNLLGDNLLGAILIGDSSGLGNILRIIRNFKNKKKQLQNLNVFWNFIATGIVLINQYLTSAMLLLDG